MFCRQTCLVGLVSLVGDTGNVSLPQPVAPNADDGFGVLEPPTYSSRSTAGWWDPRLPVLSEVLAHMEAGEFPSVFLTVEGSTFFRDFQPYTRPDGGKGTRARVREPGPVTSTILLDEQIDEEGERFLLALKHSWQQYSIRWHSRVPLHGRGGTVPTPDEPRLVQMQVLVRLRGEPTVRISSPISRTGTVRHREVYS